jgi:methyltransferase (TIGR00027 family)
MRSTDNPAPVRLETHTLAKRLFTIRVAASNPTFWAGVCSRQTPLAHFPQARLFVTDDQLEAINKNPLRIPFLAAAARGRWVNKVFHKAIKEDGVRQVLILGGGYDMRACKKNSVNQQGKPCADKYAQVKFWEVERPEVLDDKEKIFQQNNVEKNAEYIKLNYLQDDFMSKLRASNFNPDAPVLIIMEGNWMWMDDSEVEKIFKLIHDTFVSFTAVFDYSDNGLVQKEKNKNLWIKPKTGIEDIHAFARGFGFVVKENKTNLELKTEYELTGDPYIATQGYAFCTLTKR